MMAKYKKIICKGCGEEKIHYAKGLCRICYGRKWWAENQEKAIRYQEKNIENQRKAGRECYHRNPGRNRRNKLKRVYDMTITEYDEMLESQGGVCAICGKTPEENGKRLAVDHNHKTGKSRGLLCHNCNVAIGLLQDDPVLLIGAARYILLTKLEART